MANPNVLSDRYATPRMNEIFSKVGTVIDYRRLWIAVMKAQKELGLDIPGEDIEKFERAMKDVNLERINELERKRRHDVKANIEAFVEAAGAGEYIHQGMTSRDVTDNVEQMQIRKAAKMILGKYVAVLRHFRDKLYDYGGLVISARTHHQHAQPTTLGRRFAMWADELVGHALSMERFIKHYSLRGIKGPVGTQFDMLTLLGSAEKVEQLEEKVAQYLGFDGTLIATGQVYPRSMDQALINQLSELSAPCQSFATTMRLMAGEALVTEGFKEGQVGSSAMPHKMNTRSSERICGFAKLLKGYSVIAAMNAGDQWEEGDVSCSVVRRVIIPDSFYVSDGICETAMTVLNEMGAYPAVINAQVETYLPFLASTAFLSMAVQHGIGREEAHGAIKKYAVAEALKMRQTGIDKNSLAENLASDPKFTEAGITRAMIDGVLGDPKQFVGNAERQWCSVRTVADGIILRYKEQAQYEPGSIL